MNSAAIMKHSPTSTRKQVKRNIKLMQPHYDKWGCSDLTELILEIYEEKIAETNREKQIMYKKILKCCGDWVAKKDLDLH